MTTNPKTIRSGREQRGPYRLEVFWIPTDDGAELALSRVAVENRSGSRSLPPVILAHGTYARRNFWMSAKGVGMAADLYERGHDVWILEFRGHGLSPKQKGYADICAEDHIRRDLPAVARHVFEATNSRAFWVGHSFGGLFILAALSAGWLDQRQMSGVVTFGSQISYGDVYLKIPPVAWAAAALLKWLGYFPAQRFGLGPEIEPAGVILETIRWKKRGGQWTDSDGFNYWDGLAQVIVPVLCFAAARDKNDPPAGCRKIYDALGAKDKEFVLLSRKSGFSRDYDHIGMVVSKGAQAEVWPYVGDWIGRHVA